MISGYPVPEYYIDSLDINVSPRIQNPIQGSVSLEFDMTNPQLSNDPAGFRCQTELEFRIYERGEAPWERENPKDVDQEDPHGLIEVSAIVFLPGPKNEYQDYYDSWDNGSYYDLDDDFIYHIESGILQHIVNPIGNLLENSYTGLIPRMRFSRRDDGENSNEDVEEHSDENVQE